MNDPRTALRQEWTEKIIYTVYEEKNPELVETIRRLVGAGYLPTFIAQWFHQSVPMGRPLGNHVYLIATNFARHSQPLPKSSR